MITIVMGKPGSGKSTYLAWCANSALKKNKEVWSNVHLLGTKKVNLKEDLNVNRLADGLLIIDEAGFEFNSREFKSFTKNLYRFFTLHRHYNLDVVLAVQFWDRLDIVIRELVGRIVLVKPCFLRSLFIKTRDIDCNIGISADNQIVEMFSFKSILFGGLKLYFRPHLMHLFDSYYVDPLVLKEYQSWGNLPENCGSFWSYLKTKINYKLKHNKFAYIKKI